MRIVAAALLIFLGACPALAQRAPVIVIPGRPDVPPLMNGVNVSWAVIDGEFGLDRPVGLMPRVIYWLAPAAMADNGRAAYGPHYFPMTGERPGYGRFEVVPGPDRPLPPPAPSFRQGWWSQSAPNPVTISPPYVAPSVVVTPSGRGDWHKRRGADASGSSMARGSMAS